MRRSSRTLSLFLFSTLPLGGGCAHSSGPYSGAATDLGLRRVVLYRNGIGYFERQGEVTDDSLAIKVRRDQVDDLLKSLTVIDRSTGKGVSVSMPLDPETWANAALADLTPGSGSLAQVLDQLRGTTVVVHGDQGRIRGRIVMVEKINLAVAGDASRKSRTGANTSVRKDHRLTVLDGNELRTVLLSQVRGITLRDGDVALQLHRRLDASAGEGMFQQVEIVIRLAGQRAHDLAVSYVVAAPMWKPTYRVVLPKEGKGPALLQGWAVVDNTSGEDWRDVSLGLTSGEPIAFRYDLHTPRTVGRADLTEAGVARRAEVAVGETSYDDWAQPEQELVAADMPAPSGGAGRKMDMMDEAVSDEEAPADENQADRKSRLSAPAAKRARAAESGMAGIEAQDTIDYDALRRSTAASARSKQISGLTTFDLRDRVTVPNGSSTMVAVLNENVEAEQTLLYRIGGAGSGYETNPYRVVRFRNSTPFVLEPGPISIYSGDSFVGEGLAESVSAGVSATLPFAVEPAITVSSQVSHSGDEMQLLRIVRGVLEVTSFSRITTTWSAKAPSALGTFTVLVRHEKAGPNYELHDKPEATETLADAYLVPLKVAKAGQPATVTVVEQTPSMTTLSIWDARATELIEAVMVRANATPGLRKQLAPIVKLRQEIGRIDTEVDGLRRQQVELDSRAQATRANLEALKKDPAAGALRAKLSARLDEFTKDGDKLGRRIVELQSQRLEKKIALEDLLQNLDFEAPQK